MEIESLIKYKSKEISEAFDNIAKNGFIKELTYDIDDNKLDKQYVDEVNITLQGDFVGMFEEMQKYEHLPALYLFKINPSIPKNEIVTLINNVSMNIPAHNKTETNSGYLYVGKVKSCAWGRLIQHMGYHKNRKSHGLQLEYWVKKTSLNIELSYSVMFFEKEVKNYIELLEIELAKSLNPIIGKH